MTEVRCAICKMEVIGGVDYPNEEDCEGFFMGQLKVGDAICFWCIEDWALEKPDQTKEGHA